MEVSATLPLSGWGRYPVQECYVYRPEKRRGVSNILASAQDSTYLARGLGRSYGDAALNAHGGVIDMSRLNRMLAFDPETGVLECEAGVSFADILEVFVPRGFFLPVLTGTKFVTIGGAIANDVHGKNHHKDGTFSRFVEEFTLLTGSNDVITCSPTQNSDIFWATVGGIGLTGVILTARIRLRAVESAYVQVDYTRMPNIDAALAAFADSDENYLYSVAWVDCLATGKSLGRSVLMRGNHAPRNAVPAGKDPLSLKPKLQKSVPTDFPQFVLNPLAIRTFNTLFYGIYRSTQWKLVDYDTYFCPLDSIHHWNRMYGKRGFGQYQVTLPLDGGRGLIDLLERLSRSRCASFLAVLKRMGPAGQGLLSFPFEGYTLTLDIPMRHDLVGFLRELDRHVLEYGGRLYCAKDMAALPETYAAMYPRLDEFREIKAKLDPHGRISSSMARRLGVVAARQEGSEA